MASVDLLKVVGNIYRKQAVAKIGAVTEITKKTCLYTVQPASEPPKTKNKCRIALDLCRSSGYINFIWGKLDPKLIEIWDLIQ